MRGRSDWPGVLGEPMDELPILGRTPEMEAMAQRQAEERIDALLALYDIDPLQPDAGWELAKALTKDCVPGFQKKKPAHRPRGDGPYHLFLAVIFIHARRDRGHNSIRATLRLIERYHLLPMKAETIRYRLKADGWKQLAENPWLKEWGERIQVPHLAECMLLGHLEEDGIDTDPWKKALGEPDRT